MKPNWSIECKKDDWQRRDSQQERDVEAMVQELGSATTAAADAARRDSSLLQLPRLIMGTIAKVVRPRSRLGSMVAVPATASNTPRSGSIEHSLPGQQGGADRDVSSSGTLNFIKRALSRPGSRDSSRTASRANSRQSSRANSRRPSQSRTWGGVTSRHNSLSGNTLLGKRVRVCMKGRGGEPNEHFNGVIDRYHVKDGYHIQYDDGDVGWEPDVTSFQLLDVKKRSIDAAQRALPRSRQSPLAPGRTLPASPLVPSRTLPVLPLVPSRALPGSAPKSRSGST